VRSFALSAVGADEPGIIAAIADRLVVHGLNVTDSRMGILRGFFAMTLIVEGDADADALRAELEGLTLESVTLREVDPRVDAADDVPTHVVSVHGADHPGILAAVTGTLAAAGVNVCDLRTRLVEADSVYVMVVDAAVPAGVGEAALAAALRSVSEREGVEITLRAGDADVL
jgi:glycine cleavage system transcriptional repressor